MASGLEMKFDQLVQQLGEFGKYQQRLYFGICVPMMICAFHKMMWVFVGATPLHRCKLPADDEVVLSNPYELPVTLLNVSIPWDAEKKRWNSCTMYMQNFSMQRPVNTMDTENCDAGWIFDNSQYLSTAVTSFDLVCSSSWLAALVPSLQMAGEFVGSIIWGILSDRYGRKSMFLIAVILQTGFGVITSFASSYVMLIICRGMIGFATPGVVLTSYILMMEFVGPSKRVVTGITSQYFFALGYFVIAGAAYALPDWRHLQMALSLPGIIMIAYWWFLPESVRWLLANHKNHAANKIIAKVAKINNAQLPSDIFIEVRGSSGFVPLGETWKSQGIYKFSSKIQDITKDTSSEGNLLDLAKHPKLRLRAINIMYCWFVNTCIYYGLSLNTSNLAGNSYVNFAISGAVEIPSYTICWLLLNRVGRRRLISFGLLVSGLTLFCLIFVSKEMTNANIALAMFGKFSANISYATIYMYTTELFPTTVRTAAFGLCSTCGRVGAIVSPFFIHLYTYWAKLPLIVFSFLSVTSGAMAYFLPETMNKNMPDTIEDGIYLASADRPRSRSSLGTQDFKTSQEQKLCQKVTGDLILEANIAITKYTSSIDS